MGEQDIPNFKHLLKTGASAAYVQPVFPTMSYPCWTSIVTGLYAEDHGILNNYFYDVKQDLYFSVGKINTGAGDDYTGRPFWWQQHVPLWTTAVDHGGWVNTRNMKQPNQYR